MTFPLMLALIHAGGTNRARLRGGLGRPVEAPDAESAGGVGQAHTHHFLCRERQTERAAGL